MFHGYSKFLKFVLLPTLVSYCAIGVAQEVELHGFSFHRGHFLALFGHTERPQILHGG